MLRSFSKRVITQVLLQMLPSLLILGLTEIEDPESLFGSLDTAESHGPEGRA